MAFWGTEREDAWLRRKAREYERESIIRNEGQQQLQYMAARHATEIKEKEGVLDIARGLLSDARHDSQVARRRSGNEMKQEEMEEADASPKNCAVDAGESRKRPRIKQEDDAVSNGNDDEQQAEESVREHLLALSYAMFDTLYGTKSFEPSPFCQFLVNSGERALAEQIALAAIEKAEEKGQHVSFVLEEMVPHSDEPVDLVTAVRELLVDTTDESGREALFQWTLQHGSSEEKFAAALLNSDEGLRLRHALPFAVTTERRQMLKKSCPALLRPEVIGMFEDDEWHGFIGSLTIPTPAPPSYRPWRPTDDTYIKFASTSMKAPNNAKVARMVLNRAIQREMEFALDPGRIIQPSSLTQGGVDVLTSARDEFCRATTKALSDIDSGIVKNEAIMPSLLELGLDPLAELARHVGSILSLPPSINCMTRHKSSGATFRSCSECRTKHCKLAVDLGILLAVRKHPLTATCESFRAIGLPCAPSNVVPFLTQAHVQPDTAIALCSSNPDEMKLYCVQQ